MLNLHEEGKITEAPLNTKGVNWNRWEAGHAIPKKINKERNCGLPVVLGENLKLKTPEATVVL